MVTFRKAVILDLICSFLILLFLYTALSKLISFTAFRAVLQKSPLLERAAPIVAWLLPTGEIVLSLLLFFPGTRTAGIYFSLLTLIVFTAYLSYMISVSNQLPCSCGGVLQQLSWRQHLVFNAGCIGLSVIAARLDHALKRGNRIKPGLPFRPPPTTS